MNSMIPISLSLKESGAVALAEAAECLGTADNPDVFLSALGENHRLWRTLVDVARRNGWSIFDHRTSDFILSMVWNSGCGIADSHVEAMIDINRNVSRCMIADGDIDRTRQRALLAWRESTRGESTPLATWLINQIEIKAQH